MSINTLKIKPLFSYFKVHQNLCLIAFMGLFVFSGCGGEDMGEEEAEEDFITEVNFEKADFAPFVEPEFPFITTSMDGRNLGPGFPKDNISARCIAIQLGNGAYACFDPDMLRWSVAWTGDFLPMVTMAQISYNDFHMKDNELPIIGGDPKIATGLYPGWSGSNPAFEDPRPPGPNPKGPSWGPLPQEMGRWNGIYLVGSELVMSYQVQDTEIFEKPGSIQMDNEIGFTRTIQIKKSNKPITMVAAEVSDGSKVVIEGEATFIYNAGGDSLTAIGLAGNTEGLEIKITQSRYVSVSVLPGSAEKVFQVMMWKGPIGKKDIFQQMLSQSKVDMPDYRNGGPPYWEQEVLTRGKVSPDTSTFVTDGLTLPIPNPWNRNVRAVDLTFLDAHRAAIVTFEGDVWMLEGIDQDLERLRWTRFASGLYEPQSIEVVQDQIYVFGKEGIVRLHDLNQDGVADYYENFSNLMAQSIETREWASDMVAAPDGGFYVAKFGSLDMGPETSSPKKLMGFRAGSQHNGSILKVSTDGRSIQPFATGFRGPYLGINPVTGVISGSDQQGHYMPSTPVMLIEEGDFYGVPATAHRDPIPETTPPLTWIPHTVDRSGISQVWITSDKMGPLNGEMIHFSYGRPGLFRVLMDSTANGVQGGVSFLKGQYPAPTMKGAINPEDGQLYVTGFSLWGTNTSTISALTRIRYTGGESLLPEGFFARKGGIALRFAQELEEEAGTNISNFQVKRWNYQRTENYGSGHFKPDGTAGEENLPVLAAHLSDDRKAVFLAVPNMEEVMQMEVAYTIKTADGTAMEDIFWLTVNEIEDPELLEKGFSSIKMEDLVMEADPALLVDQPDEQPTLASGKDLFLKMGCIACHAIDGNSEGKIGPGMKGLIGSERHFEDGTSTIADEEYIRESIIQPEEKKVEGYEEGMPSFAGILSENEIGSIILYIKSLSE
jgi:cytochrome c2